MSMRTLTVTPPHHAGGGVFAYTLSDIAPTRLIALQALYTTDDVVGGRNLGVQLLDANGVATFATLLTNAFEASSVSSLVVQPGSFAPYESGTPEALGACLPFPDVWLPAGWQIQLYALGADPGDQWSDIQLAARFGEPAFGRDERKLELAQALTEIFS